MAPSPAPPAPGRKLRILALHSFRTSAAIFQEQMRRSKLDVHLQDLVEIVYIDAPHAASGRIPNDVAPYFKGPYFEWFTAEDMGDHVEFDDTKVLAAHAFVRKTLLEQGPFDGLMAFSQGAVLASSLIAMQQHGTALQDVPALRFCLLFAGLKSRYPAHVDAMTVKVPVPSVHIFGDKDHLREHCKELAGAFSNSVVLLHLRGHTIPSLVDYQLSMLRAFLSSFFHAAPRL